MKRIGGTGASRRFTQVRVGHLIAVRAPPGLTSLVDVRAFTTDVLTAVRETDGPALLCADYRRASPVVPEAASPWADTMRNANAHLIRSAVLVEPSNAIFNLQIERVVRCAGGDARRRIFADLAELCDWMRDASTEAERRAIKAFLAADDSPG